MGIHSVVQAEIDLNAVKNNIKAIRKLIKPKTEIMAVVKANGYGHGDIQIAKAALEGGASRLAVARYSEALRLRENDITSPILVFGYVNSDMYKKIISLQITLTVYCLEAAVNLNNAAKNLNKKIKVHINVDTGMNRLGFKPNISSMHEIKSISNLEHIDIEGIYTHFADADNFNKTYTELQIKRFTLFLELLSNAGINIPIKHAANSAAIIDHPEIHLDMVRPGIIIYGLYPSKSANNKKIKLQPAMRLITRIAQIQNIPAGAKISYGGLYETDNQTCIATLSIGYGDGLSRMLKDGEVLIHGKRAPIVGRICMDHCMVDISHIKNVKKGDEVVVYGTQGNQTISVDEVGEKLGTISYELVCMISPRVARVYKS